MGSTQDLIPFSLPANGPRRFRLVVHGNHSQSEPLRAALCRLRDAGADVEVRVTFEAGDAGRFAAEAAADGRDVISIGGDGTLHEVVNGLVDAAGEGEPVDIAVGVVPGGTGNDFAGAADLPTGDPAAALELAAVSQAYSVDLVKVHIFGDDESDDDVQARLVNVSTLGLGAEVTADAPEAAKRWLGNLAYLIAGVQRARELEAQEITVTGEGRGGKEFHWSGRAFGAAVGNGRRAGGGARLCPKAFVDDGLVDLVICPEMPFDQLLPLVGETLIGDLLRRAETATQQVSLEDGSNMIHVIYRQLRHLEIDCGRSTHVNLDGEPYRGRHVRFEVEPQRLRMRLPQSCPLLSKGDD